MKKIILLLVIIAGAGFGYYFIKLKNPEKKVHYSEIQVEEGELQLTVSATGGVEPRNRLDLKAPVTGRIEELFVHEGDELKKGDIIGYLSSSERVALIDTARAQGEKELERWKNLYKAIPLVAPIDGTVIARSTEPGQTLTLSDSIITLSDRLIVKVEVDETDVAAIAKDQKVNITLDAYPEEKIMGVVEHVAYEATVSDGVTVYKVDVLPQNVPRFMKSGMSVEAIFYTQKKEGVTLLPSSVIQYDDLGSYVYIKGEKKDSYIKERVKTGLESAGRIQVLSGVQVGDTIYYEDISLAPSKKASTGSPFMPTRPGKKKTK